MSPWQYQKSTLENVFHPAPDLQNLF